MADTLHKITVIIPTVAEKKRCSSLLKAIDCILKQSGVRAIPMVVVNGNRFDRGLTEELKKRDDIEYYYLPEGNLVKAISFAVRQVTTKFFSFLDDDDIYFPDALITRLRPMLKDDEVGLCVSGGYKHGIGTDFLLPFNETDLKEDPVAGLLVSPWLSSCSGLYRRSVIDNSIFDHEYRYLEWTYLAFVIAGITKIAFVDKPTFTINFSEESLSASPLLELSRARLMDKIAQSQISYELKKKFLQKKYAAYHMASVIYLRNGEIWKAWKYHLLCLINFRGIKYFSYTYHLLRSLIWGSFN